MNALVFVVDAYFKIINVSEDGGCIVCCNVMVLFACIREASNDSAGFFYGRFNCLNNSGDRFIGVVYGVSIMRGVVWVFGANAVGFFRAGGELVFYQTRRFSTV